MENHQRKYYFSDQNNYVDSNPAFHIYTDIDYDFECGGISRVSFIQFYGSWISYVYKKIKKVDLDVSTASMSHDDESIESNIFTLCFALSLMGRKALASASHQGHGAQEPVRIELFLHGLHSLFQVRFFQGVMNFDPLQFAKEGPDAIEIKFDPPARYLKT